MLCTKSPLMSRKLALPLFRQCLIGCAAVLLAGCQLLSSHSAPNEPQQSIEKPASKPKPAPVKLKPKPAPRQVQGKLIFGQVESAYLPDFKLQKPARVDTGASYSSLDARDIVQFERNGKPWVRFQLPGLEQAGPFSRPVEKWSASRNASGEVSEPRPLIEAWVHIGPLKTKTLFSLADRSTLTYRVLLGRSLLRDVAVVDTARQHVQGKPKP